MNWLSSSCLHTEALAVSLEIPATHPCSPCPLLSIEVGPRLPAVTWNQCWSMPSILPRPLNLQNLTPGGPCNAFLLHSSFFKDASRRRRKRQQHLHTLCKLVSPRSRPPSDAFHVAAEPGDIGPCLLVFCLAPIHLFHGPLLPLASRPHFETFPFATAGPVHHYAQSIAVTATAFLVL